MAPSAVVQSQSGSRSNSGRWVSTTMRSSGLRCLRSAASQASCSSPSLAAGIGDVVEGDEVHALVVEGVVRGAEELLVGLALVERGVVLARHEAHVLDGERRDDLLEALHALAPLLAVVGGVGEVAGEDDEVGLAGEAVHGRHGLLQRVLGVGIGGALVAPVGVGELHEVEVAAACAAACAAREQPGGEGDAGDAGQLEEIATIGVLHGDPPRMNS